MDSSKRIELIEKIKRLEGITNDERAALLQLLNQTKTYGLVWEEKQEDVEVRLQKELPEKVERLWRRTQTGIFEQY